MDTLNSKLDKLKSYFNDQEIKKLTSKIYSLELDETYLKTLSQNHLIYIHVKLHNAIYYKKPFAEFKKLKLMHDLLIKFLDNHIFIDKLDN